MFTPELFLRKAQMICLRNSFLDKLPSNVGNNTLRRYSTFKGESDLWKRYISNPNVQSTYVSKGYRYPVENYLSFRNTSYANHLEKSVKFRHSLGIAPFFTLYSNPLDMLKFAAKYLLSFRFLFIYMARTTFQAVRPLLAFCVFGEIMKLILATMNGGVFAFLFSFVLAFEVLYFFLQCFISYTFLTMFYTIPF